jgi:ubiquinone/menaquinone biosynthesis C-methylase UbiE
METSFRRAEHADWTTRAECYDATLAAVTAQAIPHILTALGDNFVGGSLLDVCCGPGHLAAAANARGARAEGVDFAASMVALAQHNYPAVSFREADAECLPYPDRCFDAVTCAFGVISSNCICEPSDAARSRRSSTVSRAPSLLSRD